MHARDEYFYRLRFRLRVLEGTGQSYQDLFADVMERRYPMGDFIRVRPWGNTGDRKNDGYLSSSRTLYQSYAPNEMKAASAIAKIDEDFEGALPYWKQYFDTWVFVHNSLSGLGPQVVECLLAHKARNLGFEVLSMSPVDLAEILFKLDDRHISEVLGPIPTAEEASAIGMADLEPVLAHIDRLEPLNTDLRPVPANKIDYNKLGEDVRAALTWGMTRSQLVEEYMTRSRDVRLRDELAQGFREMYTAAKESGLEPDMVFTKLQSVVEGPAAQTRRQASALAVLAYFFEACDIFDRPIDSLA